MGEVVEDEESRAERLLDAQAKAVELFAAVAERGILAPGVRAAEASDAIRDLAGDLLGIRRYWHKRIVRAGVNTLRPYRENPPDRVPGEDDIVFADFGPIFEDGEADFGRTFVLGDDPVKHRLRDTLPTVSDAGRAYFAAKPDITGAQLYAHMVEPAREAGWEFGGEIAGHLVGRFPHEQIDGARIGFYIAPGSDGPMRRADRAGQTAHWILEVHFVDRELGIGGFFEHLPGLGPSAAES